MFRRFFPTRSNAPARRPRLGLESLEAREVPAVVLAPLSASQASNTQVEIPTNRPIFIPVTVSNTPNGAVTTTVSSDSANVTAEVLQGGRSVRFDISGTDASNVPFNGSVTVRLFEGVAPLASQRIVDLVTSGFYTGKVFHRVADLFGPGPQDNVIIQGGSPSGDGVGGSSLPDLPDEFDPNVTFDSNGLVAFANAGDDGNNSQFFFTDLNRTLADQVAFLNFNHTIFGVVTDGFDTLLKMRNTPKPANSTTPTNPLTITGATVFTDAENAVLRIAPVGTFTGTANISVTATDADGAAGQATEAFAVVGTAVTTNSRAFVGPVANPSTTTGTPVTFTVPVTDIDGDTITLDVRDAAFSGAPANFTFTINQATRQVTITPAAGFTGSVDFKVGARDQTDRTGSGLTTAGNFDTQLVRLTVNAPTTPPTTPTTPTEPTAPTTPTSPATPGPFTAEPSAPGVPAQVVIRNSDGTVRFTVPVFDPLFLGGVRTAVGDIDNDGVNEVVVVPRFGGGPVIQVINATTGQVVRTMTVFDASFRGGLHVKVGDVAGLGYDQVVVAAGDSGGPRVTVLDMLRNQQLLNFFAGDANFRGGVTVDLGEVLPGRGQMIVTGTGPGVGGTVALFNGVTAAPVGSFAAGDPTDTTGIRIRVGNPDPATNVRHVFVAPLNAADGTTETEYDPAELITPSSSGTTATTTSGATVPAGFDFSSLVSG